MRGRGLLLAAVLASAAALAGCTDVVNGSVVAAGTGTAPPTGTATGGTGGAGTTAPGFPASTSPETTAPDTGGPTQPDTQTPTQPTGPATTSGATGDNVDECPHINLPTTAMLSFDCLRPDMKFTEGGSDWVYEWTYDTEAHWQLSQGVSPGSPDLQASLTTQFQDLKDAEFWGPDATFTGPAITDVTVDGARAKQLQTTVTVSAAYRQQQGLQVKQEQLWMLAIPVSSSDTTLWFVSVPDTIKQDWAKVPTLIKNIKVIG